MNLIQATIYQNIQEGDHVYRHNKPTYPLKNEIDLQNYYDVREHEGKLVMISMQDPTIMIPVDSIQLGECDLRPSRQAFLGRDNRHSWTAGNETASADYGAYNTANKGMFSIHIWSR